MEVAELIEACPGLSEPVERAYLEQALARAGVRHPHFDACERVTLTGGRTGAPVVAFSFPAAEEAELRRGWVLKRIPRQTWRNEGGLCETAGEAPLWISGVSRKAPAPLSCPTIDVAYQKDTDSWWWLMTNQAAGIAPRGKFGEAQERQLLAAVARLHAKHWATNEDLARLPVSSVRGNVQMFAAPLLHCARGTVDHEDTPGWVRAMLGDFAVLPTFLPIFLEVLGSRSADFFLEMVTDWPRWTQIYDQHTHTFNHGDLRRANISFDGGTVHLFDWELAVAGPATCDLQWHWLLHFWAYPPKDGKSPEQREPLRQHYLDELEAALGRSIDRAAFDRSWELGWLRIIAILGYLLVDPLTTADHDRSDIARVKHVCKVAIELAQRCHERQVR